MLPAATREKLLDLRSRNDEYDLDISIATVPVKPSPQAVSPVSFSREVL